VAAAWIVNLPPDVQAQLDMLLDSEGKPCYDEGMDRIADLREEPTPTDAILLKKTRGHYRFYVCKKRWRVIYRVFFKQRNILIVRVRPRGTAYAGFDRW
jgi:mRNA-degrading endonuclease RelE of RelBE toxin-antitoxin system